MKKSIIVTGYAAAIVIASVVIVYYYLQEPTINEDDPYIKWQLSSGPIHVREAEHQLGENIFISVDKLEPHEIGSLIIIRPNGDIYKTFPLNGTAKSSFNHYFTPELSRQLGICVVEELIGTWKLVFEGTEYKEITFQIIEEYQFGEEEDYEPVC